ncbi:MAG: hypothetical protein ACOCWG_04945, partial [bacterium]
MYDSKDTFEDVLFEGVLINKYLFFDSLEQKVVASLFQGITSDFFNDGSLNDKQDEFAPLTNIILQSFDLSEENIVSEASLIDLELNNVFLLWRHSFFEKNKTRILGDSEITIRQIFYSNLEEKIPKAI